MDTADNTLMVPMRDGVELVTRLWSPDGAGPWPLILIRNAFGPVAGTGFVDWAMRFSRLGYVVAVQDVRGNGDSPGQFEFFFNEAEDGYDAIEWLAVQPWCTGRVGMLGVSYVGTVQWLAARERPPHLTCIVPTAPAGRIPDEVPYQGGAVMPPYLAFRASGIAVEEPERTRILIHHRPLVDLERALGGTLPMLQQFLEHPTLDDYWSRIRFTAEDFAAIEIPSLMITGWFDEDQIGTMEYWNGMNTHSGELERHLVVGPWTHALFGEMPTKLGDLDFGPDSAIDMHRIHQEFFDHHLREVSTFSQPRARIFVTGANEWRDLAEYPPAEAEPRPFYLHSGGNANTLHGDGRLDQTPPTDEPADGYAFDPSDPVQPVPDEAAVSASRGRDQRYLEERDDVLVYTGEILDEPVEITGHAWVELFAATDGSDTDFTARLLDVQPDGRAIQLGAWAVGGIIRARYRNGGPEELLTPGEIYEYRIDLRHFGHRFLAGHRIRVEISSSYAPMFRPNPNTGNPIATDTELRVARQTIHHRRGAASALVLPVVPI